MGALILFQLHLSDSGAPAEPPLPAKVADARLLPPLAAAAPVSESDETTSRPLFVPARRPSPPAPVDASPAFKRGQFALQGTIVAGEGSHAFLKEVSSGKVRRVAKGEKIAELTLSEVSSTSVTLALGEDSEVLPLQVAKGPPPAVQPRAVPGSQPAPLPDTSAQASSAPVAAEVRSPATEGAPAWRRSRSAGQGGAGASGAFGRSRSGAPQATSPAPQQAPSAPSSAGSDSAAPGGEITFAEIARRRARELSVQPK